MHFKLKEYLNNNSLYYSLGIHVALVSMFIFVFIVESIEVKNENLKFTVVEKFVVDSTSKPVAAKIKKKIIKTKVKKRQVFGLSRKSITSDNGTLVKKGNTVSKTPDTKKLKKDDPDSLPIPADEFLISLMPRVIEEVRPSYPVEAKKRGIQGKVIFEILIDKDGKVRDVVLLKSLEDSLDIAAREAMLKFKFSPAQMDDEKVAVKIKYAINFVLEDSWKY